MDHKRGLRMLFVFALASTFLSACAQSTPTAAATTVALKPAPTTTTVPATDTPTSVPPTSTPVPPTETTSSTETLAPTATLTRTAEPTSAPTDTPALPTATPVPPTATRVPPAATRKPTATAVPKFYTVAWKTGIQYDARNPTSFWCKLHNEYQNGASEDMPFQNKDTLTKFFFTGSKIGAVDGFEPVFGIANPDGSINRWALGGWYAKAFGWPNGIEKFPPDPIKAGTASGDWTFYSNTGAREYCRFAYVKWKGQISAAEFAGKGDLVNANATLPAGAP